MGNGIDRLTVVSTVYHQNKLSGEPVEFGTTYSRLLQTTEQPFSRDLTVAPGDERDIDFGWVESAAVLFLRNLGRHKDDVSFALLRDGVLVCEEVPRGESCMLTNPPRTKWRVRNNSNTKSIAIRVVVIPR